MNKINSIENLRKFLNDTHGKLRILEHQIPLEKQMEYFFYTSSMLNLLPEDAMMDLEQFATVLLNPTSSLADKQKILSALAISKEARAYRILQEYLQAPDSELTDWAQLALMESHAMLESEFTNEKQVFIATGLGGKGKMLRYYVLLLSSSGNQFLDYQLQVIEKELTYALKQNEGEIEEFTIKENYIELSILLPIQTNIGRLIENVVSECNQYGHFIAKTFTITNVKKLTENEIAKIIKEYEDNRTGS